MTVAAPLQHMFWPHEPLCCYFHKRNIVLVPPLGSPDKTPDSPQTYVLSSGDDNSGLSSDPSM